MRLWKQWLVDIFSERNEFSVEEHPVLSRIIKIQRDRYYAGIVSKAKSDEFARALSARMNTFFNAVSRKNDDILQRFDDVCQFVLDVFESNDEPRAWIRDAFVMGMAFRSALQELGHVLNPPESSVFFVLEKKYLSKKFL
ncbi:hypothetical protein COT72_03725 [archaeon CG10_big_fil_rev_8_21_14_0_10_43_11]|nr:MAG: hypothetical protein COT72_03725 [archaeon CG10_big_fil_rev_8_21_14_0_10_43_11]